MFNLFKKKVIDNQCYAPVNGECISLDDVADQVFSSRMMWSARHVTVKSS